MDAIGKLVGGIAHNFNNILSIIIGNCEILMKKGENIKIELFLAEDVGYIRFDPTQIDKILINLCINSRDVIIDNEIITIETYNKVKLIY